MSGALEQFRIDPATGEIFTIKVKLKKYRRFFIKFLIPQSLNNKKEDNLVFQSL